VSFRGPRTAAAALAAVALLPTVVRAEALADAEREATRVEERLTLLETTALRPDESAAIRAARKFAEGETQYLLGDWLHAAVLVSDAVDEPAFRASRDFPTALFYLGDALRRQGTCAAARASYGQYLTLGAPEHRGDALVGALDCAVKEGRGDVVEQLLAEADRTFGGNPPPEIRYLAAKAVYQRADLAPDDRFERAMAAFAAVPAPFLQQAAYFQGVLLIGRGDLASAGERFAACGGVAATDARQREVVELCALALGRVEAELGHPAASLDAYQRVPRDSRHFDDALYEIAWGYVKSGQYEAALRTAEVIVELSPESLLAPEATVLEGHLLLRLGRYSEATEAYSRVINDYAPVRDEIDAILTMHEDPVRYFNDLIGHSGNTFDAATVLPPAAVKWASTQKEVAVALGLAAGLDGGRRDLLEADALADRLTAVLARGGGLDAFPLLHESFATAQALGNAAAALEGAAATAALEAALPALDPEARAEVERVHGERLALERQLDALPRTREDVVARLDRMRVRIEAADQAAFRLGYQIDGARAAIAGSEAWLGAHRGEIAADAEGRQEVADELRKHREQTGVYDEELRGIKRDLALARDAAAGAQALEEEARLRDRYLALLARERELLGATRGRLDAGAIARIDRAGALAERLGADQGRARAVADQVRAEAGRRASALKARVDQEKQTVSAQAEALDGVQGEAKELVGRIAFRSFSAVRSQFYRLVLKADVGLVDVAWARKRARLEKIQQLAQQKAFELQQIDQDYRELLREVD